MVKKQFSLLLVFSLAIIPFLILSSINFASSQTQQDVPSGCSTECKDNTDWRDLPDCTCLRDKKLCSQYDTGDVKFLCCLYKFDDAAACVGIARDSVDQTPKQTFATPATQETYDETLKCIKNDPSKYYSCFNGESAIWHKIGDPLNKEYYDCIVGKGVEALDPCAGKFPDKDGNAAFADAGSKSLINWESIFENNLKSRVTSQDQTTKTEAEPNINSIIGTYTKEDGNLKEWEDKLKAETGPDSDVSKQLDECEKSKQNIVTQCQQSPGGWHVDVAMDINNGDSGKNYQFQDYRTGGCKKSQKFRQPLTVNIDNKFSSAADKNYQVSCNMLCSSWDCEDTYLALVDDYKGQVGIIRNGVAVTIGKNTPIQEGDIIATGEGAQVFYKLVGGTDDKSYVEVKPNTKLLITDPEVGAILIEGDAKTHIEKGSNRKYTITTPTARVVAKGTDFLVSVEANTGKTIVYLYNGTLQIVHILTNQYIMIKGNEKVTVDAQTLGTPTQISNESEPVAESQTLPTSSEKSKGGMFSILIVAVLIAAIAGGGYYFIKIRKKIK